MLIIPVITPLLGPGDSMADAIIKSAAPREGDIVVVSSKAVATVLGEAIDLSEIKPSNDAKKWASETGRSPAFMEAVIKETRRMNGKIAGACPGALLTELRPLGLESGTILTANAGLDESNVSEGFAIGWPQNPVQAARELRKKLGKTAVIISDSNCRPRRIGVTAFALAASGLDPLSSQAGRKDLFGKPLKITTEAVADQLATAANAMMGNAGQSAPAAIIRDHSVAFSDFEGWVPGIEPAKDLFAGII